MLHRRDILRALSGTFSARLFAYSWRGWVPTQPLIAKWVVQFDLLPSTDSVSLEYIRLLRTNGSRRTLACDCFQRSRRAASSAGRVIVAVLPRGFLPETSSTTARIPSLVPIVRETNNQKRCAICQASRSELSTD